MVCSCLPVRGPHPIRVSRRRKQRSPLSPRRPSHVSVAADLPPGLSSNASDALRAARADDRLYDPLCLHRLARVINPDGGMHHWSVFSKYSRGYSCIQCELVKRIKRFASSVVRVMVCPAAAAAAVQIIQSAVGGTGSGRKPRNRIHTLCGPWKRNVEGKQQGGKHFGVRSAKGGRSRRRRCSPSTTSASRPLTRRP